MRALQPGTNTNGRIHSGDRHALLLMLDNAAPSPCHEFRGTRQIQECLSPTALRDVLLFAAGVGTTVPPMVASVGSVDALDPMILRTLKGLDLEWLAPPAVALKIACDDASVVAALDAKAGHLTDLDDVLPMRAILHISPENSCTWFDRLRPNLPEAFSVSLRAKDLDLFEEIHFLQHERQLESLGRHLINGAADSGMAFSFNLSDDVVPDCGAGTSLLTVAPDGLVYPCPAFYHAGDSHALASIRDVAKASDWRVYVHDLCSGLDCRACAFEHCMRQSTAPRARRFAEAGKKVRESLPRQAVQSRRRWRGLSFVEAAASRIKTKFRCDHDAAPFRLPHDITMEVFRQALCDAYNLALRVTAEDAQPEFSPEQLRERWRPSAAIPPGSRMAAFRSAVLVIVDELLELGELAEARNYSSLCDILPHTERKSPAEPSWSLSNAELVDIQRRYNLFLGWEILVHANQCDESAGFACGDTSWLHPELTLSRMPVDDWFAQAQERYKIQQCNGYHLEVDFENGRLLHANPASLLPGGETCQQSRTTSSGGPAHVVHLADMDLHCIQSLMEMRDSFIDVFRSDYHCAEDFHLAVDTARALVQQIGEIQHSINAWYQEKATGLGWPTAEGWSIDLDEGTLMLTEREATARIQTAPCAKRT